MAISDTSVPIGTTGLNAIGDLITTPTYDRAQLRQSIVPIDVAGFHCSHLATYDLQLTVLQTVERAKAADGRQR